MTCKLEDEDMMRASQSFLCHQGGEDEEDFEEEEDFELLEEAGGWEEED